MSIKILIVDDSRIFRSVIEEGLSREKDIEVIGSVWNGVKAIEFINQNAPDIVTLDIQMPDMDGIETLEEIKKINARRPSSKQIGVIMLSSHTQKGADITVKALEMGAFDFTPKPESRNLKENIGILSSQLVVKIRNYAAAHLPSAVQEKKKGKLRVFTRPFRASSAAVPVKGIEAVLIGVSTGGPKALTEILPPLCEKLDVPIFIVQHMPPTFTQSLANSLNAKCSRYRVLEGENNGIAEKNHVYIAPGGRHMVLQKKQDTIRTVIHDFPPEKGCRPSVDLLFKSAAAVYGHNVMAVILTGMGSDGTDGAKILKENNVYIIAQDEESSVVWGMPGSARNAGVVDDILPLNAIPDAIISLVGKTVSA